MKLTAKEIRKNYRVISLGYGSLQGLLAHKKRLGYTTSASYGWRSDNFLIDGIIISTGYNPVSGIKVDRDIIKKYEDAYLELKTNQCEKNINYTYQQFNDKVDELLSQFIDEVRKFKLVIKK